MGKFVKVEGEAYIRRDTKTVLIDIYEEDFILDDSVESADEARSIIRKGLLDDRLKKTLENYKKFRTCQVLEFKETKDKPEGGRVDKLLVEATKLQCAPDNLSSYGSPKAKEKALEKAIHTAKNRKNNVKKNNDEELGNVID